MPSKREALTVTVIMALFLLLTSIFIGLRSEHLLMAVLYLVLFFAGLPTRKLPCYLSPFLESRMTGCVFAPTTK